MRLNKYLSRSGVASRRKSDQLIKMAMTTVNNEIVLDPAFEVGENDEIRFDGKLLKIDKDIVVIAFNKPKNVITSAYDPFKRKIVMDYINHKKRLVPIGRLDKDSTGLLLITNDGDLHHFLTHPKNKVIREYDVFIERLIKPKELNRIDKGIKIGKGEIGKAKVVNQNTIKARVQVRLILMQGKKREIRRIFRTLKIKLFELNRVSFAGVSLNGLKQGEYRMLDEQEIYHLKLKFS